MARIKKQLTELIGGTPLLELSRFSKKQGAKAQVIAKLEYFIEFEKICNLTKEAKELAKSIRP